MSHHGPKTAYADRIHAEKYRLPGETFDQAMRRVATALQDDDRHGGRFLDVLLGQRFMPAGRIQAAMGCPKAVTPYNCYVSGNIPDSFVARDNPEQSSIMHRAEQAAATMRMGGGIGYGFGHLRPRNALIKKLMSRSGGPLSFMPIFDGVCGATSSYGNRRGAQMGVLPIWHPDIREWVTAKHEPGVLQGFNMSIGVTDDFMEAKAAGRPFDLKFEGEVYDTVDARELWDEVMRSTWNWAEPGVLFMDQINRRNNLWYCEEIEATNPCGEQPLPPFGACLLGSFNLVAYLVPVYGSNHHALDLEALAADVPSVVRAMDNVVDRALYPLPEQEREAKSKRRMGIGVTGLANALEACGLPYGSPEFLTMEDAVLHRLTRECYIASSDLAVEKGSFELFDVDLFCRGAFFRTLDFDVQQRIRRQGLRNSHLTSIAPTGTISLSADNISSSIEPVYRYGQERWIIMDGGRERVTLYDHGFGFLDVRGRRASMGEVSAVEHIGVLTTAQRHIDSAVSKTVNVDGSMPWEDFCGLYDMAYEGGAKGCTTFNKDGKRAGLFREEFEPADLPFPDDLRDAGRLLQTEGSGPSCEWDPTTGRRSCE
jgi:ribonucleoside-diphosphate reductase alpha chain